MNTSISKLGRSIIGSDPTAAIVLDSEAAAHLRWLLDGPVRAGDGMLSAWVAPEGPANTYQEATGYLITLLCYLHRLTGERRLRQEAIRTAVALAAAVGDLPGCGRGSRLYLFDTAVCVRAVGALLATFPDLEQDPDLAPVRSMALRLGQTAREMFAQQRPCDPPASPGPPRWSETFNAHQIKATANASPWLPAWQDTVEQLKATYLGVDRFFLDPRHRQVYLHVHCYAVEGLLSLPRRDPPQELACADFLAGLQTDEGAIPRFWSPPDTTPGHRHLPGADATAQAVRIWQCVDRHRFQQNIQTGLVFLESLAAPGGGVSYSPDKAHVNAWATIFTIQARLWQHLPADPRWLI